MGLGEGGGRREEVEGGIKGEQGRQGARKGEGGESEGLAGD